MAEEREARSWDHTASLLFHLVGMQQESRHRRTLESYHPFMTPARRKPAVKGSVNDLRFLLPKSSPHYRDLGAAPEGGR